jgi:hypothetical protein
MPDVHRIARLEDVKPMGILVRYVLTRIAGCKIYVTISLSYRDHKLMRRPQNLIQTTPDISQE